MRTTVALVLIAGLMAAPPASAQNVVADIDQLGRVMKSGGYTLETKSDGGVPYLRAERSKNSYAFSVYLYGCDEGTARNCKSVQFYSGFSPKKKVTLDAMNQYARENRWGRIYLDKVGDPAIEMDVDLEKGGMSEDLFLDNLEYFETVMNEFAKFVFDN